MGKSRPPNCQIPRSLRVSKVGSLRYLLIFVRKMLASALEISKATVAAKTRVENVFIIINY